jgi:hypothetical protein
MPPVLLGRGPPLQDDNALFDVIMLMKINSMENCIQLIWRIVPEYTAFLPSTLR